MMIWLKLTDLGLGIENVEKQITYDENIFIILHQCSSIGVPQNV